MPNLNFAKVLFHINEHYLIAHIAQVYVLDHYGVAIFGDGAEVEVEFFDDAGEP